MPERPLVGDHYITGIAASEGWVYLSCRCGWYGCRRNDGKALWKDHLQSQEDT